MRNRTGDQVASDENSHRLPGVIDTIGMGYEALLARPILVVPPIVLDLYFWLGIHITSRPLAMEAGQAVREIGERGNGLASAIEGRGAHNLSELLAVWTPTVRMPTFVTTLSSEAPYRFDSWRPALSLPWWGVLAAGVILFVLGLLIGAEYLLALAAATRSERSAEKRRPGTGVISGACSLTRWYAAAAGLALLAFWPVLAAYGAAELTGAGASFWLILLLFLPLSWAFVLFFFSVQAMFVDESGALAALRSSFRVVRSDGWNSFGMIVAYFLLTAGFPQVWGLFISEPLGLVVAIVGNAVIGTGIIAATMVFYRDRVQQLNVAGRI